jgi:hypothetical protein
VIALTAFIGAVIEVHALGLTHPAVLAALVVAVAAGAWFIRVERRSAGPMLPLQLFKLAGFTPAVLFGVFVNFAYYGVIFVLSFYLQKVRGFSVLHAGLIFLPLTGTFLFANITSGWLQARVGSRLPMIIGGLIGGSGYALLGLFGISKTPVSGPCCRAGPDPGRHGTGGAGHDHRDPGLGRQASGRHGIGGIEHGTPGGRRDGSGSVRGLGGNAKHSCYPCRD